MQGQGQAEIAWIAWIGARLRRALPPVSGRPHPGVSAQPRGLTGGIPWCSLPWMSSSLVQRNKAVAKRKGTLAAMTVAGAGVVVLASPVVGIIGLAGAAYLTWDWFSFRVKNGMRF